MEELIKRLERVIQTGVPDKDGMHPISAETVLEVVKGLHELGTNLASLGTDCISRQAAIDIIEDFPHGDVWNVESMEEMVDRIKQLPTIQPEIVRCDECLYRKICSWKMQGAKFCSFAEKREVTT